MIWKGERRALVWITLLFLAAYFMPLASPVFHQAVFSALDLARWYAREHVILCLLPAFFIAGSIAVFLSPAAVIRYFGSTAPKWIAYSVASVSGTVLAVCSCTVLPLFAGIYRRGAGLGPAVTFLYAGPAINVMAIVLTFNVLGIQLGLARVVGAVVFAVIIGLIMHTLYRRQESERAAAPLPVPPSESSRPLGQTALHFLALVAILVFANWADPGRQGGVLATLYHYKWHLTALFGLLLAYSLVRIVRLRAAPVVAWAVAVTTLALLVPGQPALPFAAAVIGLALLLTYSPGEPQEWVRESWGFARQIMPLLAAGVLVAGFLFGSPTGGTGVIPPEWIEGLVGGNSLRANLVASMLGAVMYFATLTEIPILQGLLGSGMGQGPALALLLAGPALSLPNMLVIRTVLGTRKTLVFIVLVVIMATISGLLFGTIIG